LLLLFPQLPAGIKHYPSTKLCKGQVADSLPRVNLRTSQNQPPPYTLVKFRDSQSSPQKESPCLEMKLEMSAFRVCRILANFARMDSNIKVCWHIIPGERAEHFFLNTLKFLR
jgi:hypothetical protein